MSMTISSNLIMVEAKKRGWRAKIVDENNDLYEVTLPNSKRILFYAALSELNSGLGFQVAMNKDMTRAICEHEDIPYPESRLLTDIGTAKTFLSRVQTVVVKPVDTDHGVGITVGVKNEEQLKKAILKAKEHSDSILLQELVEGSDHRFLVIGDKVFAVALRKPPTVSGDGISTIKEQIETLNSHEWRGGGHGSPLTLISLDDVEKHVGDINRVLAKDKELELLGVSNLSQGGVAVDLTHVAHEDNKKMALRTAKVLGLRVAGVDIMSVDITKPSKEVKSVVIEINKDPGLRMHHYPIDGEPRNAAGAILDELMRLN